MIGRYNSWQCHTPHPSLEEYSPQLGRTMSKSPQTPSQLNTKPLLDGNPGTDVYTRRGIILRILLFTLLETGFIVLAARALIHPIIFNAPTHVTLTETKGGFQLLFIIWHALAAITISDLVVYTYSSEWTLIYEKTGILNSSVTDRVSKLTSGPTAYIHHFLSKLATRRFRIALILSVLLMGINGFGPSTVFVTTSLIDTPAQIPLANVSLTHVKGNGPLPVNFQLALQRANTILRMELFDKITFGYGTKENLFIPWPKTPLELSAGRLVYETDVLDFTYSCAYHTPLTPPATSNLTSDVSLAKLEWLLDDHNVYETHLLNSGNSTNQSEST